MCKLFNFNPSGNNIQWSVMSYNQVVAMFRAAGVTCSIGARDDYFWYPDENTWIEWLKEAHALTPAYQSITATQRGYDCDKFARELSAYVARQYLCNGCFEVWGQTPDGPHGWNVFITPVGAFEAEPQNADIWAIGTNPEYLIKTVYRVD